jgi:hypothetical protein
MFTTGSALVILAVFLVIFDIGAIPVPTVFQILGANIVINCGIFLLLKKFETRYVLLEYLLDVGYIIIVLVVFGMIFDWYSAISVWVLAVMAVVVYILAITISINKIRRDTREINELLQKRKEKKASTNL